MVTQGSAKGPKDPEAQYVRASAMILFSVQCKSSGDHGVKLEQSNDYAVHTLMYACVVECSMFITTVSKALKGD